MSVQISDRLFRNYLHCKYKAYQILSGKSGVRGDYEKFQDDLIKSYRLQAREHFQRCNQIISPENAPLNYCIHYLSKKILNGSQEVG
jgi:hypothetical protein